MQLRNLEQTSTESNTSSLEHSFAFQFRFQTSVEVFVQSFRGLPLRIRTQNDWGQFECMLPEHFQEAAEEVLSQTGEKEQDHTWFLYGYRHGLLEEVAQLVTREIAATIDEKALKIWKSKALKHRASTCSVSLMRTYLRNNPHAFNEFRNQDQLETGSFNALHKQSQELDAVPHQTGAHKTFQIAATHAQQLDKESLQHLGHAGSTAAMIKAMNSPSRTLQQNATHYFANHCNSRRDRYIPHDQRK